MALPPSSSVSLRLAQSRRASGLPFCIALGAVCQPGRVGRTVASRRLAPLSHGGSAKMRPSVDRLAKLSGPLNQEFRVRWRNGEVRWLRGAEKKKKKGSAWAISALKNQAILWVDPFRSPIPTARLTFTFSGTRQALTWNPIGFPQPRASSTSCCGFTGPSSPCSTVPGRSRPSSRRIECGATPTQRTRRGVQELPPGFRVASG